MRDLLRKARVALAFLPDFFKPRRSADAESGAGKQARLGDNLPVMTLPEQQIVPYAASSLRGEKLLVLAPHPDDEVIGCGGLIALHAGDKRQVRVVVATDGTAAPESTADRDEYRQRRERETIDGLKRLGGPAPFFLRFPDRGLATVQNQLREILKTHIQEFAPDLVAVPSPIEVHPDHVALTRALFDLIQSDEDLVGDLAMTRVAFYEVSQPIQPNALVDITPCAEVKFGAIEQHASQSEIRDYQWFARGLNQYRSMTLGGEARYAEAYHVMEMPRLRTEPWSAIAQEVSGSARVEVQAETVPICVVIRTRGRERWLQEAVASVRANEHPASIVVVNDGGPSPAALLPESEAIRLIDHARPVGRAEAMNVGVRAAATPFIAFLDDDDLYYPEHLTTLSTAARSSSQIAYYSDAVSTFHEPAEDGSFRETMRLQLYGQDFDRDLLLFDNYIPLPTLLVRREEYLEAGGFDSSFDLLEDWDFLLRLSERGAFLRIPRVTCEVRHFRGGDSAILGSPEGSPLFREAKLRIWAKYADRITPAAIADVFEKQKRRAADLFSQLVEKKGLARHLEVDVRRLEREKSMLLEELQRSHRERGEMQTQLNSLHEALLATHRAMEQLQQELSESKEAGTRYAAKAEEMSAVAAARHLALTEKQELIGTLYGEIKRLNEILEQIYRSRTWKLHQFIERLKGRT